MPENSTVLIIEESPPIYSFLEQILRQELKFGQVIIAKNGDEGMHFFKNKKVDWIFCDVELSRMNGLEVLSQVREHPKGKDIPFIVLTSPKDKESTSKALILGARAFINKPFTSVTVIDKVKRLLAAQNQASKNHEAQRDRRINVDLQCRISFPQEIEYEGNIINMSLSGCLVRAESFHKGGTIFDPALLSLMGENGKQVAIKATLIRLEVDKASDAEENRMIRASFRFVKMDEGVFHALKSLLAKQALRQPPV